MYVFVFLYLYTYIQYTETHTHPYIHNIFISRLHREPRRTEIYRPRLSSSAESLTASATHAATGDLRPSAAAGVKEPEIPNAQPRRLVKGYKGQFVSGRDDWKKGRKNYPIGKLELGYYVIGNALIKEQLWLRGNNGSSEQRSLKVGRLLRVMTTTFHISLSHERRGSE